jgi:internalin A
MDAAHSPARWWKRPRVRLTVRTLMILVLVLAGGLGWIVHRARVQREAVAAIERSGGRVRYAYERKDQNPIPGGKSRWPGWLIGMVGVDYFETVVFAELFERGSDAEMAWIGRLGRLEELYLNVSNSDGPPASGLTDAGMVHVAGLDRLRTLLISSNRVGNAGLKPVGGLTGLQNLTILMTQATPEGVSGLRRSLPKLRVLWYGCTIPPGPE